jgi:hypothetical protein
MDDTGATPTEEDVATALARVEAIDLTPINGLLRHEDPGFWTEEILADVERAYRRFLVLNLLYPSETLAVNRILDEYWHSHILDTRKYAADCDQLFGKLLDHFPYFGIEDEEDRQAKLRAFAVTQDMWQSVFGESLTDGLRLPLSEARLTLDRVVGDLQTMSDETSDVLVAPKSCKNGQHCKTVIGDVIAEEPVIAIIE